MHSYFRPHLNLKISAGLKVIWDTAIPPSKSLLVWRILLKKVPTDEILVKRGCSFPLVCFPCGKSQETLSHLFLESTFATAIWNSLFHILNIPSTLTTFLDIIMIVDRSWSPPM